MICRAIIAFVFSWHGALACTLPPDAIVLLSESSNAPRAYAQMANPQVSAPFDVEISFCNVTSNGAADIEFDAVMPAHQHGMNYKVSVTELGGNSFKASKVVFHMPGLWEIRVDANLDGQNFAYKAGVGLE